MADVSAGIAPARKPLSAAGVERSLRFWSGVILMTFVATHLLNHAVGIFGVAAMSEVQQWRAGIWRSLPGTVALYGAAAVHMTLALKRALSRSTWRMPLMEASQLLLGLAIPLLLIDHVIGTRLMVERVDFDDSYINLLRLLWPGLALSQSVLVVVVWIHGVIGIAYAARDKAGFRRWRTAFIVAAVLVPILGSGLIDHNQNATAAAMQMAEKKACAHRS
jgi:adenylate cyclase